MTTKINPSEISSIIKKKIDGYKGAATEANVGEVLTTADGIVQIFGLEDAMYGELLDFGEGTYGLALNLENDSVGAVVLGDSGHIKEGQKVKTTGRVLDVPVGEGLLQLGHLKPCLLYTSPSPRDKRQSRMPSSA